jgi:4-amino-4-deoxy-L-arabinose transferase-like glycosyltransferase
VLALLHLLLALAVFDPTVFTGGDNAAYLSLARSLLERHAYLSTWEPLTPPHTQYPPVFPGMIAIGLLLGIQGWAGIKAIVLACSAAAVAFTYLWLRRRRRPGLALGVGFVVAISPGVLALSHVELSDVPFWAFAMLALWAFERLGPREHLRFAVAVVAVVLAYFTRSAGLPLLLAAFAWLAWRRRWRQLAILAVVAVPLAFLWWLRGHAQGGSAYGQLFWYVDPYRPALGTIGPAALLQRMLDNARSYLGAHLPILLAERATTFLVVVSCVIALLALYGWAARLRRPQVAELYFPLYVGLLFVWPAVWAGERFLLPAYPLLLAYAGEGAVRLLRRFARPAIVPLGFVTAAAAAILAMPAVSQDAVTASTCREAVSTGAPLACLETPWQDFFQLSEWARTGLPPGAAAFARKPRLFYVFSGHRSLDIPTTRDPAEWLARARANRIDYVVVDRLGGLTLEYFGPILAAHPDAFCLVQSTQDGGAALLRFQSNAAALLTGPAHPAGEQLALARCGQA